MMMMANSPDWGAITASGTLLRDLNAGLSFKGNRNTAIFDQFWDPSKQRTQVQIEWNDVNLRSFRFNLNANISSGATSLVIDTGSVIPSAIYPTRTLLLIDDELFLVNSQTSQTTTTTTYSVTGAQNGTTAAAHTAGTQITIGGANVSEAQDISGDDSLYGTINSNFTQIFFRTLAMSHTAQAIETNGGSQALNSFKEQAKIAMDEIKQEMQLATLYGKKYRSGNGLVRTMGGIVDYAASFNQVDTTGGVLTETMLINALTDYTNATGEYTNLLVLASAKQQARINAIKTALLTGGGGVTNNETSINKALTRYEFVNGLGVDFLFCPAGIKDTDLIILDRTKFKIQAVQGLGLKEYQLAKTGLADKRIIAGEFTAEARNFKQCVKVLRNLTP